MPERLAAAIPDWAALITGLILERPLVRRRPEREDGLSATDVDAWLAVIQTTLQLPREVGRCRACGDVRRVSVDRPA